MALEVNHGIVVTMVRYPYVQSLGKSANDSSSSLLPIICELRRKLSLRMVCFQRLTYERYLSSYDCSYFRFEVKASL